MKNILVCGEDEVRNTEWTVQNSSAVINVADSVCETITLTESGHPSFWFPIQELGYWGHSPFYRAAKIVDYYNDRHPNLPVIIHCHAGVCRSVCVALAIQLAEFEQEEKSNLKRLRHNLNPIKLDVKKEMPQFESLIKDNRIPEDIIKFLSLRYKFPSYSALGLLGEMRSKHSHSKNILL